VDATDPAAVIPSARLTIEELAERHHGLAAPADLPQLLLPDELDTSEEPVL
jgi:hypothetical protein